MRHVAEGPTVVAFSLLTSAATATPSARGCLAEKRLISVGCSSSVLNSGRRIVTLDTIEDHSR